MGDQYSSYHSGQVLSLSPSCKPSRIPYQHDSVLGIARVNSQSRLLWTGRLIHLQLRATWEPPVRSCVVLNVEEFKPTLIINVITDTVLLVTMVAGLFRLRTNSSRTFGVVRLLWRQVGSACSPSPFPAALSLFSFLFKGIVWLLAATVAGIPPMVNSASFPVYLLSHRFCERPRSSLF